MGRAEDLARPQLALRNQRLRRDCIVQSSRPQDPQLGFTDKLRGCHEGVTGAAHRAGKEITMRKQQVQGAKNGMRGTGTFKAATRWLAVATTLLAPFVAAAGEVSVKGSDTMVISLPPRCAAPVTTR